MRAFHESFNRLHTELTFINIYDTVTLNKTTPHFQLLPMAKVDQSQLPMHEAPPLK